MAIATRREEDSLGTKRIPASAYYGIQTFRAVENFPISGLRLQPEMVRAFGLIKKAAALTNAQLHLLNRRYARAIERACNELLAGKFQNQFVVDVYQAGAGTSFNMNVNEVLANRANEFLGGKRGAYKPVHPNDHVNMAQSTNDVVPTAIRLAALMRVRELLPAMETLQRALQRKRKAPAAQHPPQVWGPHAGGGPSHAPELQPWPRAAQSTQARPPVPQAFDVVPN